MSSISRTSESSSNSPSVSLKRTGLSQKAEHDVRDDVHGDEKPLKPANNDGNERSQKATKQQRTTKHTSKRAHGIKKDALLAIQTEKPPHNQKTEFLDLPPELRNRVYLLLLESDKVLILLRIRRFEDPKCRLCPQILATCRFIHKEATPILYGSNKFTMCEDMISDFFDKINASGKHIKHLRITCGKGTLLLEDNLRKLLKAEPNLKTLEIFMYQPHWSHDRLASLLCQLIVKQRMRQKDKNEEDLMEGLKLQCPAGHVGMEHCLDKVREILAEMLKMGDPEQWYKRRRVQWLAQWGEEKED